MEAPHKSSPVLSRRGLKPKYFRHFCGAKAPHYQNQRLVQRSLSPKAVFTEGNVLI